MGHQFAPTSEWLWNNESIIHYETQQQEEKRMFKKSGSPMHTA